MFLSGVTLYENEGWQVSSSEVPVSERQYTVRGLRPARAYQFRVSAVNDVGEGSPSQPSIVKELPQERKYTRRFILTFILGILLYRVG